MNGAVYLIHCLRPLHQGAGGGLGGIDRPIAREVHTGLPYVQSSSIKGTARALAPSRDWGPKDVEVCFGPEKIRNPNESRQGALVITDALLLLFPVRSDAATWVWTTCPLALARFARWCALAGESVLRLHAEAVLSNAAGLQSEQHALAGGHDDLLRLSTGGPYGFADDTFLPMIDPAAQKAIDAFAAALAERLFPSPGPAQSSATRPAGHHAYWRDFFARRVVLVTDRRLTDLAERFTVVEPGIAIDDDTGTTTDGSLRYTELLPEESVLFSYVTVEQSLAEHAKAEEWLDRFAGLIGGAWQIGADETKGKGIVRAVPVAEPVHAGA